MSSLFENYKENEQDLGGSFQTPKEEIHIVD